MKLKLYSVAVATTFCAVMLFTTKTYTHSSVPDPGHSGDPLTNQTCASGSGCHGSTTQDGTSAIALQIGTSPNLLNPATASFVPAASTEYYLSVGLTGTAQKYGFELSALTASNQQAGSFTVNNTNVTSNTFNGIQYVSHKNATAAKTWIFKWTSPATINGPITFYIASNFANGDTTSNGDVIYKKAVSINGGSVGIISPSNLNNFTVYPNPASEKTTLSYNLLNSEYVSAQIMNSEGTVVKNLFAEKQAIGIVENTFNIAELAAGKYFVHINAGGKSSVKPLVKF